MTQDSPTPGGDGCTAARHGTAHAYKRHGCRCPTAVEDMRRLGRQRARRLATGPVRTRYYRSTDVDPIAVERAVFGDVPTWLTTAERLEAVAKLTRAQMPARDIADQLRIHPRTVQRYRSRYRQLADAA